MSRHWLSFLLTIVACTQSTQAAEREATQARIADGKALFDEKCRTVAGEKIYRKVENVEGLLLMKVRPDRGDVELANRDWPGAAFARESRAEGFISTFLGSEYASNPAGRDDPITPTNRGYIANPGRAGGLPGYRWVEVIDEKDGKRYRITGSTKVVGKKDTTAKGVQMAMQKDPNYDLNIYRWSLTSPYPRRHHRATALPTKTMSSPRNATSASPAARSASLISRPRKCWAR